MTKTLSDLTPIEEVWNEREVVGFRREGKVEFFTKKSVYFLKHPPFLVKRSSDGPIVRNPRMPIPDQANAYLVGDVCDGLQSASYCMVDWGSEVYKNRSQEEASAESSN